MIEPLGFQRMRAEALSKISSQVDSIPTTRDELLELPRIGSSVANATLCFTLERRLPSVDRNVVRVYERVFGDAFPDTERDQRRFATAMLPEGGPRARMYNLALLDFGALVCTKWKPHCTEFFAKDYCIYYADVVASGTD